MESVDVDLSDIEYKIGDEVVRDGIRYAISHIGRAFTSPGNNKSWKDFQPKEFLNFGLKKITFDCRGMHHHTWDKSKCKWYCPRCQNEIGK